MAKPSLQELFDHLSVVITREIEPLFVKGTKFTLLTRVPGNAEAECLITNDEEDEIIKAIQRAKARPADYGTKPT